MMWVAIWSILDFASVGGPPQEQTKIAETVCSYEWENSDCVAALGIVWCESQGNPRAVNGADHGHFQVNKFYWAEVFGPKTWAKRYEIESNTAMAHHIYSTKGAWKLWTCGRRM